MNRMEARGLVKRAEKFEFSTDDEMNMMEEFTVGIKFPVGVEYAGALSEMIALMIKEKTSDMNYSYKRTNGRKDSRTRDIRVLQKGYTVDDEALGKVIYNVFDFRYRDRVGSCMKFFFIFPWNYEQAALTVYTDKNIRRGPYDMEPQGEDDPEWWMRTLRHEIYTSLKAIGFQFERPIDYTQNERLDKV